MITYPRCCGSEDGELVYGIDPAEDGPEVMASLWKCHTCGVMTVVSMVYL